MKKRYYWFVLVISVFMIAGCGDVEKKKESTGIFGNSTDAMVKAESFSEKYEDDLVIFKYPSSWQKSTPILGTKFIIAKDESFDNFNANMNIIELASNLEFSKVSTEDFKLEYSKNLSRMGHRSINFVTVEKGLWNGEQALYLEYTSIFSEEKKYYAQYFYDDGKNMIILSFTSSEGEWPMLQSLTKDMALATTFKEEYSFLENFKSLVNSIIG